MAKKDTTRILWVDLEMTGLDPNKDRILEVAAIVTDWDMKELATYEAIKKVSTGLIKKRMVGEFWEQYSHVKDGLVAQNANGKSSTVVEDELLAFVDEWFPGEERIILAGNSIHQDRKFIINEWPRLDKRLHYRMLDVSAWKVVFEHKFSRKFSKPEAHRALSDIRGSIEELQYYLKKVK